jgi:hypothetical protein
LRENVGNFAPKRFLRNVVQIVRVCLFHGKHATPRRHRTSFAPTVAVIENAFDKIILLFGLKRFSRFIFSGLLHGALLNAVSLANSDFC